MKLQTSSMILIAGVSMSLFAQISHALAKKSPVGSSSETVWVMRPDGAKSCAPESGQGLDGGAKDLENSKIQVFSSRKGSDGKMHMQMCGAETGSSNLYQIRADDLNKAVTLGFKKAPNN